MKKGYKIQNVFFVVFLVGLVIGTLMVNILFAGKVEIDNLWSIDAFDRSQLSVLATKEYFVYILMKRLKQFLVIFILLQIVNKFLVIGGVVFAFSFNLAALLSLETMRMGIQGIMASCLYFFPHYLLYIGAGLFMIYQAEQKESRKIGIQFLGMLAMVLTGCFLEAFINPGCLKIMFDFLIK